MLIAVVRGVEDLTSVCWQKDNICFVLSVISKIEKFRGGDPLSEKVRSFHVHRENLGGWW
jgi:hypothetical protein